MARSANKLKGPHSTSKPATVSVEEARGLISMIEKSQVPFGESAPIFAKVKAQLDAGKELNTEDYKHLMDLVKKAKDWERAVESSAMTEPEETLSG